MKKEKHFITKLVNFVACIYDPLIILNLKSRC